MKTPLGWIDDKIAITSPAVGIIPQINPQKHSPAKIAFIGLGNVGGKLAGSLLCNGFDLTVRAGSASILEVVANYLATANLVSLCEALVIAKVEGMDLNTAYEAIRISSGNSFAHETESQVMLNGNRHFPVSETACTLPAILHGRNARVKSQLPGVHFTASAYQHAKFATLGSSAENFPCPAKRDARPACCPRKNGKSSSSARSIRR